MYKSNSITTNIIKTKHHVQFYKAHLFKAILDGMSFHSRKGHMNGKGHGFLPKTNLTFPHTSRFMAVSLAGQEILFSITFTNTPQIGPLISISTVESLSKLSLPLAWPSTIPWLISLLPMSYTIYSLHPTASMIFLKHRSYPNTSLLNHLIVSSCTQNKIHIISCFLKKVSAYSSPCPLLRLHPSPSSPQVLCLFPVEHLYSSHSFYWKRSYPRLTSEPSACSHLKAVCSERPFLTTKANGGSYLRLLFHRKVF